MLGLRRVQLQQTCRAQTSLVEQLRSYAASEQGKQPDEAKQSGGEYASHQAQQSTDFFTTGVKATIGTVLEKAKVAVGLEKPLGKEGAGSMEPAGAMENKSGEGSRAERYKDMIGLQKKKSDELTKGAKVEDLYSEAKPVSAANTKPGHKEAFKYDE